MCVLQRVREMCVSASATVHLCEGARERGEGRSAGIVCINAWLSARAWVHRHTFLVEKAASRSSGRRQGFDRRMSPKASRNRAGLPAGGGSKAGKESAVSLKTEGEQQQEDAKLAQSVELLFKCC